MRLREGVERTICECQAAALIGAGPVPPFGEDVLHGAKLARAAPSRSWLLPCLRAESVSGVPGRVAQCVRDRNGLLLSLRNRLGHDLRGEVISPLRQAHLDVAGAPFVQLGRTTRTRPAAAGRARILDLQQVLFFQPPAVRRDGLILGDGALANNTPISQAISLGADRIFVLPAGVACALAEPPASPYAAILQAVSFLTQQRLIHEVSDLAGRAELHVMPPLCPLSVSSADFSQARALIARARAATGAWLDAGKDRLPRPERFLSLHGHPAAADAPETLDLRLATGCAAGQAGCTQKDRYHKDERQRCSGCGRWPCGYCGVCHLCEQLARTAVNGSPARPAA